MAVPTHSFVVSRTGDDLDLANGTTHQAVQLYRPTLEWRKAEVVGRYQAGARLVNAVPEVMVIGGVFRCLGATWDDVDDATNEMFVALQQFEYTVTTVTGSVSETWQNCQPATIRPVNGERVAGEVVECFADYEIQIRCTPNIGSED